MKKVIKLTENELVNLVKRVIKEQAATAPKKIDIRATEGSNPEVKISVENGKKVLHVHYESGLNEDQKFVVTTEHPATVEPKGVFATYKGNNVFVLGKNKVPAKVIAQL